MSNRTGRVQETEAQARAWRQYGRASMSKPPATKDGERLMAIARVVGESSEQACTRASQLGWWARRVKGGPWSTVRMWCWVVRV